MARSPSLPLFWQLLESAFQRAYQTRPLDDDPGCLIAYNLYAHSGPEVPLQDGTVVRPGDSVLEVHFRREALLPLMADGDPLRMGIGLTKLGDRDIPRLAEKLERDPELAEVKALHALTLFHRGVARWGFEVQPVREPHVQAWFTLWHRLLLARDHAHGLRHVWENRERLVTRHVWASRGTIIRRFGAAGTHRRDRTPAAGAAAPPR